MESIGASIIQRAIEKDKQEQYTMALVLYQEGLQVLIESIKGMMKHTLNKLVANTNENIFFQR